MDMLQGVQPIGAVRMDSHYSYEEVSNEIKMLKLKMEELEQQVKGENKIQDLLQET